MDTTFTSQAQEFVHFYVIPIGWKLLGAVIVWIIGGWGIRIIRGGLARFMRVRHFDVTLARYLDTGASIVLKLLVVIAMLGVLGIETTSFAALLAAAGIAVGAAWAGLLANFAAGLFLLTFRPFRVGDVIAAAGVTGTVREIGIFVTAIDTADNVLTYVGNNKLFADNVQNFSANEYRRVDLIAQVSRYGDLERIRQRLTKYLRTIPNVLESPPAEVEILTFNAEGPVLAVRPFCRTGDYWQVYFDTNRAISEVCAANG